MKKQLGLSLIEAAMVLALAAVVVSGVLYYYNAAKDNRDRNDNMDTVMNIVSIVNKLYPGYGNSKAYTGLDNSLISKMLPRLKRNSDGNFVLSGGITLQVYATDNIGAGEKKGYRVVFRGIPPTQCLDYATLFQRIGSSVFGTWIAYDGTGWTFIPTWAKLTELCQSWSDPKKKITLAIGLMT